jgi:transposase
VGPRHAPGDQKKLIEADGTLVLVDEAGVSLTPLMPRTWAPRGKTPRIKHNVNGGRLSAIGGVDLSGEIYFRVHKESIKSAQVMEYLEQLLRHIEGHVVVLWDGLPPHRSSAVKEFEARHGDRLSVFRLPAYCPDFNPVEWLWADVKWNKMKGYCPRTVAELKKKLRDCVRSLRRKPEVVRSFFRVSSLPIGPQEETKLRNYQ